jgi:hypothetical protein
MGKKEDEDTNTIVKTTTTKDEKMTERRKTKDEAKVQTAIPKPAEAIPSPHEVIVGENQEDEGVAGTEVGRTGPVPGPGPDPGLGPQLVTEGLDPTRRRPEAEDRAVVEDNPTIPPAEDETGAQTNGISYGNSLGE